jgi:hypothetical protein
MYLAYADDSGDSGLVNSTTDYLVLGCLVVHDSEWQSALDQIIEWRRELKTTYNIPMRAELKAEHFIYGRGPLRKLKMSRRGRLSLYKACLGFVGRLLRAKVFAIAIAKQRLLDRTKDPRRLGWTYLMQRLDTLCSRSEPSERVMLFPDEGHGLVVQKAMRQIRRYQRIKGFYGTALEIPARSLVEDPVNKNSQNSYFTQVADWVSYVAHRSKYVAPNTRVPSDFWDELGNARILEVNSTTGGPPGIVVWPRQ